MDNDMEFMDVDGPEFLLDINNQIANFRAISHHDSVTTTSDIFNYSNQHTHHAALEAYNQLAVLDTNFLISKLGYLDTVLDLANENPGSLLVLVPWVVVQELDGLKSNKHNTEVSTNARKAMRFIEMRLRDKTISLRGQKMHEVRDKVMLQSHGAKGDDRILDCCMYFQQMTRKPIILLSNDRNLCIKVMVHDMDSISAEATTKMEALLNQIASNRSVLSKHNTDKYKKEDDNHSRLKQGHKIPIHHEDYVMDIDEFYPNSDNNNNPTEDFDMMIDDDNVCNTIPIEHNSQGTSASIWAYSTKGHQKKKHHRSNSYHTQLAYLDNDPTLIAPKRPFRPEDQAYDWAKGAH